MLGYFDDVDTFSTKALRLHCDDSVSPPGLAPPSQLNSLASLVDNAVVSQGNKTVGGIHTRRFDLDVMHEADEVADADLSSSTPPPAIQPSDFAPGRRSARSHTSQGIPSHSLLSGLDSIHEDKSADSETPNGELEKENEKVSTALNRRHMYCRSPCPTRSFETSCKPLAVEWTKWQSR